MTSRAQRNDAAIRLEQLDRALVWVRQNASALGLGANLVTEGLREERDELIASVRKAGDALMEDTVERHANERAARHGAAIKAA